MQLKYVLKSFDELTLSELYDIMRLRQEVFVVEQDCPYLDADGVDSHCYHLLGLDANDILYGYTRIIRPGLSYDGYASIGRVVIHPDARQYGNGQSLMQHSIKHCHELFPNMSIKISAQTYLLRFYTDLGFVPTGEEYLEDGIPHVAMVYG